MTPKSRDEKSHLGIPGSKAACAYPGRIVACRALLQPSSRAILQTAWHVGPYGGIYWRLVKTSRIYCARVVAYAWCHFEVRAHSPFTPQSKRIDELHVVDDLAYIAKTVLEAFVADISVASRGISVLNAAISYSLSDPKDSRVLISCIGRQSRRTLGAYFII